MQHVREQHPDHARSVYEPYVAKHLVKDHVLTVLVEEAPEQQQQHSAAPAHYGVCVCVCLRVALLHMHLVTVCVWVCVVTGLELLSQATTYAPGVCVGF